MRFISVLLGELSGLIVMETKDKKTVAAAALSEHESKKLLARYGIPVVREELAVSLDDALEAARRIGFPVALKACGAGLSHKTELGVVELNVGNDGAAREAYQRIAERAPGKLDGILVQEMVRGNRELICGLTRDEQFGPCVMFGLGGVFVEAVRDVVFRVAPIEIRDALDMMGDLKGRRLLGDFRGEEAVDKAALGQILIDLGRIGIEEAEVLSVDINPLIVQDGMPVAVDALVVKG
jgi:succinyl-CoA synthetase beta subunit